MLHSSENKMEIPVKKVLVAHCCPDSRWKNELTTAVAQQKGQAEEIERGGKEVAASLRKQLESLEVAKNNELARMKEIHG